MPDVDVKSRLSQINVPFRAEDLQKNNFSDTNQYGADHPDALSDGDRIGRGEVNGVIGTSDDISKRNQLLARNRYQSGREYDAYDV